MTTAPMLRQKTHGGSAVGIGSSVWLGAPFSASLDRVAAARRPASPRSGSPRLASRAGGFAGSRRKGEQPRKCRGAQRGAGDLQRSSFGLVYLHSGVFAAKRFGGLKGEQKRLSAVVGWTGFAVGLDLESGGGRVGGVADTVEDFSGLHGVDNVRNKFALVNAENEIISRSDCTPNNETTQRDTR